MTSATRFPFAARTVLATVALMLASVFSVSTSAEERLELTESVIVNAGAGETWAMVGNFADLGAWHPAVSGTEMANGEPTLRGGVRVLTIGDNVGTVTETLTEYDAAAMRLSYVINSTDVLPVKDYASTMRVLAIGDDTSMVIWSGSFQANGPTGPEALEAMTGVYRAGLDSLASVFGG